MSKLEIVDKDNQPLKNDKEDLNFIPHPNTIIGVEVKKDKTPAGVILPATSRPKTPICKLLAVGENTTIYKKDDVVYVNPAYMQFAEIDGVDTIFIPVDAIIGKIPKTEDA